MARQPAVEAGETVAEWKQRGRHRSRMAGEPRWAVEAVRRKAAAEVADAAGAGQEVVGDGTFRIRCRRATHRVRGRRRRRSRGGSRRAVGLKIRLKAGKIWTVG